MWQTARSEILTLLLKIEAKLRRYYYLGGGADGIRTTVFSRRRQT